MRKIMLPILLHNIVMVLHHSNILNIFNLHNKLKYYPPAQLCSQIFPMGPNSICFNLI